MATELKSGIWIEGFDKMSLMYDKILTFGVANNVLYKGKTSLISEERAKLCVHFYFPFDHNDTKTFKDYSIEDESLHDFETAKESIQSACEQEYCIIYRTI